MTNPFLRIFQIVLAISIPFVIGMAIGRSYPKNTPWYRSLKKSPLVPPAWVFPIMWTYLYCSMGLASYLVWKDGEGFSGRGRFPLLVYTLQLILNWIWTPLFFGAHLILASFIDSAALFIVIMTCAFSFFQVNAFAGFLIVPYIFWGGFASYLNLCNYLLN